MENVIVILILLIIATGIYGILSAQKERARRVSAVLMLNGAAVNVTAVVLQSRTTNNSEIKKVKHRQGD